MKKCVQNYNDYKKYIMSYKNDGIKDVSLKIYIQNLKKIFKELFNCDKPNINFFKDYMSVIEYVDNLKSNASKKTMITSIIVLLKSHGNFPSKIKNIYSKKLTDIAYKQNTIYLENVKSDKENDNWISYEEINSILENLKKSKDDVKLTDRQKLDANQKYIILRLYTDLPPVRNDYAFTKIFKNLDSVPDNEKDNYMLLDDKILILRNYKTYKFYGEKKIIIPNSLLQVIKTFEKIKKTITGGAIKHNYLLVNTTNLEPMSRVNLTKTLNKIFYPKKISTTILRKIYLSNKYPISHSMNEMQKDADIMGHDIITARKIYTKIL